MADPGFLGVGGNEEEVVGALGYVIHKCSQKRLGNEKKGSEERDVPTIAQNLLMINR